MFLVITETNEVIEEQQFFELFPNISFPRPLTDAMLADFGASVFVPPVVVETLTQAKVRLKAAATYKRWQVETGGLTLPNGLKIATGKDDQDRITGAIAGMEGAGISTVDFKAESGWVTLDLASLKGLRSMIALHVQACFAAERAHHEAIDALAAIPAEGYDVSTGWPISMAEST